MKLKEKLFEIVGEINLNFLKELSNNNTNIVLPIVINKDDVINKYFKDKPKTKIQQQERIKSRAYVRSQMQFLMVLASTESHVTQDVMPAVTGGPGQAAEGVGVEKDWSSDSSRAQGNFALMRAASNSSSIAFQPVSMLKSHMSLCDTGVMSCP
jgi:hypothetical protein